jgi:hypothetical protein
MALSQEGRFTYETAKAEAAAVVAAPEAAPEVEEAAPAKPKAAKPPAPLGAAG